MKTGYLLTLLAVTCFMAPAFTGCTPPDSTGSSSARSDGDAHGHSHDHDHGHDHSHDHDHDHDHAHAEGELPTHGPNNGHLFKLEGSDMIGEWIHYSNSDIIRVLLLDAKLENVFEIDGVAITPTAGDDKDPFILERDPDKNKPKKNHIFMLDEKRLSLAMSLGVSVEFTVGDDKFSGKIEPHVKCDH